ncbi:disease resistance protein RGA2-like [Phragmites australis]|uniref:disease resistance protein RGA2-like n=1 Tax=Phragmites australis TaxID=29695 RepID=UPI002D799788|nr:disease resistance protein RGA2-like [Phragmites australis]XP_062183302.1 disease resistance protein RGA2-like [Phragmites australis]XP_062183303.1 disease resistance protein RGA2-like [Phragmites australis]
MEAALASGLLKAAGGKLVSLIASEFDSIMSVKKDLSELKEILELIASRLPSLQEREMESNPSFPLVKKLKNVAYDIGDLIHDVHLEAEKQIIESGGEKHAVADCFCAKPKSFMFRCKIAHKIKAIKVRLDEIVKQTSDMNTILPNLPVDQPAPYRNNATAELNLLGTAEESKIPRRDQEKDKIISKLVESNEGDNVLIVSIIGLGGSGKTTLAKHICQDEKIKKHFKETIFRVHVSREFDLDRLIGKLFEDITKEKSDLQSRPHMVDEISKKLSNNKFLLVLDDAWNKNRLEWEQFVCHVNRGTPGSRVLLTTRDQKVAEAVESWYILNLNFLSEPESWGFFLKISGWTEEEGSELIQVGKDIVKKCGGVPLAIKILGSVLRGKSEISTLRAIRGSSLWNEEDIEEQVFASLKLSYIHLENHLKPCFTFCSIFPKGYKINKDHLIAQWIAHGFVNPQNEDRPEDIGSEYFDSLVKVGFLQDSLENWYNEEPIYKMHDLVHDLTRKILQHEMGTSLQRNIPTDCTHRCRYFSLTSCTQKFDKGLFDKVRALYVSDGNPSLDKQVKKNCYIRSVVLDYTIDTPFPLFILKFEYLGYLEIRNFSCIQLPEAISGCWNLQALYFINCKGFVTLPKSIGKLKKLRALELKQIIDLESLPQSIGDCRGLQYLKLYSCDKLRQIPNSIGKNENLRVLQIVNCTYVQQLPNTFASRMLRTLNLSGTGVTTLPEWVTLIGTLECIDLQYCRMLVELPRGIVNLKRLEVLNIYGCWNLRCMRSGFGQLTRLKRLGLFVVGCGGDGARISELENLDMLSGKFEIKNLKYLTDPGDAEKACLKRKNNIQSLELNWSLWGREELVSDMEKDLGVLDALEPPSEIKMLEICGYRGHHLPCWMKKQSDSSYLESKPPQFFCLTRLTLRYLPNLEELWTTTNGLEIGEEEVGEQYCFPVLSHLDITCCPKLIVEPYFPPCLESLTLEKCNDQLLSPGRSFFRLLPPHVDEPSSSSRVLGAVPHLKELTLESMTASSIDWGFLQHLIGLESLQILGCNDLTELPESMRGLTSLQSLCIGECSTLAVLPEWLGELSSLKSLWISGAPMMASLPQSIQHLTSLQKLSLLDLSALTVLPETFEQLSALWQLNIEDCSALQSLPRSIKRLAALHRLVIHGCPDLARRYKEGVGEDWQLVSHIPEVFIF